MPPKSAKATNSRSSGGANKSGPAVKARRAPQASSSTRGANRSNAAANSSRGRVYDSADESDPFPENLADQDDESDSMDVDPRAQDGEEQEEQNTIPPELLTRLLHEFFEKDGTRISKDANVAVAKYMDIFVREAIARTAVEKDSGFLEVSCSVTFDALRLLWGNVCVERRSAGIHSEERRCIGNEC